MKPLAAVVSGVLFGIAFPPLAIRPLAWIAFVPALVAVRRASGWRAAALAALFGATCTCATVDWLPRTVARYYEQPWAVGFGLFAAITLLMVVPPWTVFGLAYRALSARYSTGLPPLAAAAWVASEYARANLWTGNPWVLLGYTQIDAGRIVQVADLTGVYGLSFLVAWVNVAVAETWIRSRAATSPRAPAASLALALGALAAAWGYGQARLTTLARADAGMASVDVALVQDDQDLGTRWEPGMEVRNLTVYLELTHETLQTRRPRIVVWPELAMTFFVEREPRYRAAVATVLSRAQSELLTGGLHLTGPESDPRYLNSAFVLSARGDVLGRYDKTHLLPFTEYFPFPRLDVLRRRFARARVLTPGSPSPPLPTPAGPVGVVICNEALFPDFFRAHVRAGATWLAVLTNDSWLGDAKFSGIAFDMARMRAVETHRSLVRASTWGPSAFVDAGGRVVAETRLGTRAVLHGTVRPRAGMTAYVRFGDAFAVLCLATVVAALLRSKRVPG